MTRWDTPLRAGAVTGWRLRDDPPLPQVISSATLEFVNFTGCPFSFSAAVYLECRYPVRVSFLIDLNGTSPMTTDVALRDRANVTVITLSGVYPV